MRRIILPALLATLLLAPSAHAAGGTTEIIRDCALDGVLDGHYSPAQLRKARANLPTDVDEYSDCRDVLSRAIAAATQSSGSSGGSPGSSGGASGSSGAPGGAAAPAAPAAPVTPSTPQDQAALQRAS